MNSPVYKKERFVKAEEQTSSTKGLYHEPLLDTFKDWNQARQAGSEVLQKGFTTNTSTNTPVTEFNPRTNTIQDVLGVPKLDLIRFLKHEILEELEGIGKKIDGKNHEGSEIARKRGKIQEISKGLIFLDGDKLAIDPHVRETVAKKLYELSEAQHYRNHISNTEHLIQTSNRLGNWEELKETQKAKYYQSAYEIALALHLLERAAPAEYYSILDSSKTLTRLTGGKVEPYLMGLSQEFQTMFLEGPRQVAYNWRNMLSPDGVKTLPPVLSPSDIAYRNQVGLGNLELLLTSGALVLDYLRDFGQEMTMHPFRRTEIKDEHSNELLKGVPLAGNKFLMAAPEVLVHVAREHHEMWRFSRELSWLFPDQSMHQPPRIEHKPWKELSTLIKNKDLIAAYGLAFMLGNLSSQDFGIIRAAAAPGNPLHLPLTKFEASE